MKIYSKNKYPKDHKFMVEDIDEYLKNAQTSGFRFNSNELGKIEIMNYEMEDLRAQLAELLILFIEINPNGREAVKRFLEKINTERDEVDLVQE